MELHEAAHYGLAKRVLNLTLYNISLICQSNVRFVVITRTVVHLGGRRGGTRPPPPQTLQKFVVYV